MRAVNRIRHIRICLLAGIMALCLMAPGARAADGLPLDFDTCAAAGAANYGRPAPGPNDYTYKVVNCVENTVEQATLSLLTSTSNLMSNTVAIMFAFALAVFGMRTMLDTQGVQPKTIGFIIRFGIVSAFSYKLGGLASYIFASEEELVSLVSQPLTGIANYTPWNQIDTYLSMLIGFAPCIGLAQGLIGIVAAALFSSTVGLTVFIAGLMALVEFVLFIFDVVYVYLQAILAIGFQLAISPLVVPMGIFLHTEKYVTRWLNALIAAMLTPVMLFGFLSMFLPIFNTLIDNILTVLGVNCFFPVPPLCICPAGTVPADFSTFWKSDVPLFSMQMPTDPNFIERYRMIVQSVNMNGITGATMSSSSAADNSLMHTAIDLNPISLPQFELGNSALSWNVAAQLAVCFVALWIFASLMKTIAMKIPQIAESIAASLSGVSFQPSPLTRLVKGQQEKYDVGERNDPMESHAASIGKEGGE